MSPSGMRQRRKQWDHITNNGLMDERFRTFVSLGTLSCQVSPSGQVFHFLAMSSAPPHTQPASDFLIALQFPFPAQGWEHTGSLENVREEELHCS